jgi:hypothetical protein
MLLAIAIGQKEFSTMHALTQRRHLKIFLQNYHEKTTQGWNMGARSVWKTAAGKAVGLWNLQSRSPVYANKIKGIAHKKLKTPVPTRSRVYILVEKQYPPAPPKMKFFPLWHHVNCGLLTSLFCLYSSLF